MVFRLLRDIITGVLGAASIFLRRWRRARCRTIGFRELRNTAATLMLPEKQHPNKVPELLGHATVTITLDAYSHILPSLGKEIAAPMDRIFAAATAAS